MSAAVLMLAASQLGCLTETQSVRSTTVSLGEARSAPSGPSYVTVDLASEDGVTRVAVVIARSCRVVERLEELRIETRETQPAFMGYVGPGALIALGVLAAAPQPQGDPQAGVVFIVSGGALYALIAARSGTEETPLPPHESQRYVRTVRCHVTPAAGVEVALRGARGSLEGRTDRRGVVVIEGELGALGHGVAVFADGQPVSRVSRRRRSSKPAPPPSATPPPAPPPPPSADSLPPAPQAPADAIPSR
jgi:hypothetical protein